MAAAPVEFFTLRLQPGEIYHLDTVRDLQITNVSYSNPEDLSGVMRSVQRVQSGGRPSDLEMDEDDEDDEDEDEEDEDEEDEDEDEDEEDEDEDEDDEEVEDLDIAPRVPVFTEEDSYVVCSLIPEKVEQVTLNLQISEEEEVGLSVTGTEPVDIIGNYLLPSALNDLDPEDLKDIYGEGEDDEDDDGAVPPGTVRLLEDGSAYDNEDEDDEEAEQEDEEEDAEEDAAAGPGRGARRARRRATTPGGLVAVRDADYAAMTWYPESPGLTEWNTLYHEVTHAYGYEADAGRRLFSWVQDAGFPLDGLAPSASAWCSAPPAARRWGGGLWAERCVASNFAVQAKESALADDVALEQLAQDWLRWAEEPAGWFAVLNGEVLARA